MVSKSNIMCDLPSLFDIHTSVSSYLNMKRLLKKNTWKMCQLLKLWENASVPGMWHVAFFWQILDKPQMISEYISCHLCHLSKKPKENRSWNCSFYLQPILKRYLKSPAFSCQSQGQITPNACPQNCLGSSNSLIKYLHLQSPCIS